MIRMYAGLILSYFLGSIPFAYLIGKTAKGIDLRQHGSGNLGATNAYRILGKGLGTTVLILDIAKGMAAVLLAKYLFYATHPAISENLFYCLCAIAVVSGHNWSIFLGFKGGKGVASSLGALLAFSFLINRFIWVVTGIVLLWLLIFLSTGFVSLASILCSAVLPALSILFKLPTEISLFLSLLAVFSLIKHKSNIFRLLHKKESRFNTKTFLKKLLPKALSK